MGTEDREGRAGQGGKSMEELEIGGGGNRTRIIGTQWEGDNPCARTAHQHLTCLSVSPVQMCKFNMLLYLVVGISL